jgi:sensor histidine kinase regulating citrate/malate metabolism
MASLGWGVITVDLNGVITFINSVACDYNEKTEKSVGDLLKMYLKYAMEKRTEVETIDAGRMEK